MGGYYGQGGGTGTWVVMVLVMLLFWAGVVTIVILLIRRTTPTNHPAPPLPSHESAERILHERFARGEIDETEYTARHTALRRSA